ncbi:hypothetical protein WK39_26795 [Burkholderia cepacia]|nr:hypothetical protein WK39_26795 [Burkholderia cepacia]KVS54310.1 hypothetical protein WK40_31580 [Burkholderia cepacia]
MERHEVAADVLGPDFLNCFAQVLRVPELLPAPGNFENRATHLVAFGIAAPHFAQLAIGR